MSLFSLLVGKIDQIRPLTRLPEILFQTTLSVSDLLEIRDDSIHAMQDAGSAALKNQSERGYEIKYNLMNIRKKAQTATTSNRQLYEQGEFGASWIITLVAIVATHQSWGQYWAYGLAIITLLLIIAVATRIVLINTLSYDEIPKGNAGKMIAVWFWNDEILGSGYPLLFLSTFQFAKFVHPEFYEICIDALKYSARNAVVNPERDMISYFYNKMIPDIKNTFLRSD
jgi:hypothetical protein